MEQLRNVVVLDNYCVANLRNLAALDNYSEQLRNLVVPDNCFAGKLRNLVVLDNYFAKTTCNALICLHTTTGQETCVSTRAITKTCTRSM